jgi:hypothetical protein
VFVASFGFDHVWPQQADTVAAELSSVNMDRLSDWNVKRELESFQETCREIRRKYQQTSDPSSRPRWLLVLVNKVDLYWDALDSAAAYYLPTSIGPFNEQAQRLLNDIGGLAQFQYIVLPVTIDPAAYAFRSNFGSFEIESQLASHHGNASIAALGSALEELSGQ